MVARERFQVQLYAELLKLLNNSPVENGIERLVEISCGRGGGLHHLATRLPPGTRLIGLDFAAHAIAFCQRRYAPVANLYFVRGNALHLPFSEHAIDVLVSVEASHAYGDDAAFLREVARVLRPWLPIPLC